MSSATGYITVVQEERFRLVTDQGQGLLLTLAQGAPLSGSDLCHLHASGSHVAVDYDGEPNTTTGVAHRIGVVP